MKTLLFILKQNLLDSKDCEGGYAQLKSSGLFNSARMVTEILNGSATNVTAILDLAADGNCIDRLVTLHKPDEVILEAVWVTPAKLAELAGLHPTVQWTVRLHSEVPFLAQEGIAISWLSQYRDIGPQNLEGPHTVRLGFNSVRCMNALDSVMEFHPGEAVYMPNLYNQASGGHADVDFTRSGNVLNIGCFGAVRPFKNTVNQAIAAIEVAKTLGLSLEFHINGSRAENGGEATIKSLHSLFEEASGGSAALTEHLWRDHASFKALLGTMDLVTQVSYTETFNIVAADAIAVGVPVVTSSEVPWSSSLWHADCNNIPDIRNKMLSAIKWSSLNVWLNRRNLSYGRKYSYSYRALEAWKKLYP